MQQRTQSRPRRNGRWNSHTAVRRRPGRRSVRQRSRAGIDSTRHTWPTIVAAAYCPSDAVLYIAHAGDSRCYRVRDGRMEQLTRDHSLLQDALLERPDLTESDLAYLPRNVITRALGIGPSVELDVRAEPVRPGDCFLLCSDGLHGLVTDEDIVKIVVGSPTLTEACQALIQRANANGGKDNVTSVLIRIEDGDAPWAPSTQR